jgi:hypothetical protein
MSEIFINVDPEDVPIVNITVDENSAQSAIDAAAAAQEILENILITASGGRHPYNQFKFIQKGFGNTDLQNEQIGDIYCGWSDDGTIRYTEAKWLGGLKNNADNFTPLVQTQI